MRRKSSKKNKNKIYRPVPMSESFEKEDYEDGSLGDGFFDGSHFEPYGEYDFVDHANSDLNTKFDNPFVDNSKFYKDFYKPRPILNYDFYNAYREYREMEKKYSPDLFLNSSNYGSYELYKLSKNYPYRKRPSRSVERESDKVSKELKHWLWFECILTGIAVIFVLIIIIFFIYSIFQIDSDSTISKFVKFLLEAGVIFGIVMLIRWARNKERFNKLKDDFNDTRRNIGDKTPDVHPYLRLCNNLVFLEDKGISFVYPTKKIDENYKKYKSHIEAEWEISSHKFITNRFFRMKVFDCHFPNHNHYRFFVEIKYNDCFPDYPELINIENQLEFLPFIPKDDTKPKASLANYKSMIKKRITELIAERIPKMQLKEVIVAAGCTSHNSTPKSKNFKQTSSKPSYMESESEREEKVVYRNEMYFHLEDLKKKGM